MRTFERSPLEIHTTVRHPLAGKMCAQYTEIECLLACICVYILASFLELDGCDLSAWLLFLWLRICALLLSSIYVK